MKKIRMGLTIAALTTVMGTAAPAQGTGGAGAGASAETGSGAQTDNRPNYTPMLGLLGLLGLMGLKRRNDNLSDARR